MTEATCFIARLVRDWRVEVLPVNGESRAAWEARCMRGQMLTNFGVAEVSVRLVRRG